MTKQTKAYIALIFICITWGTTYLAIRIGVIHYPAFLFAGVRQLVAGLLLVAIALMFNKKKDITRKNILRQKWLIGVKRSALETRFVLAEGTHQSRCLFGKLLAKWEYQVALKQSSQPHNIIFSPLCTATHNAILGPNHSACCQTVWAWYDAIHCPVGMCT